jgi:3-oxoacyl-[acyl-carrier-protein] synthase-1
LKPRLVVTGVGILNPVGLSGLVALHSVRSGVSRLLLQPFPDRVREWLVGSSMPKWEPHFGQERLAVLAIDTIGAALERADAPLGEPETRQTTAVIFGCPEKERPGYQFPSSDPSSLAAIRNGELESIPVVEVVAAGACSAQASLARAAELLATRTVRRCVVGAVDSQLQLRTIRWHESNFRLKCSYVTDGLMPGEASCFLVVESEEAARARGAKVMARLLAVNVGLESATILSDQPNTAAGLTGVVRATLAEAGVRPADVGMVWSDLNGESYRAREWAFSEVRLGFEASTELMHPADCHGDLGAATDANLLGLAALCHGTGWSEGKPLLVVSGSENGVRAATLLMPGEAGGPLLQVSRRVPRVFSSSFKVPAPPPEATDDFRQSEDPPRAYFEWQLREEHRDELASLHYQRNAILRDRTMGWRRLREPEQRMLNHLDAAVAGGPTSMAVMAAGVRADEEGLCFAGALLLGALPNQDNLAWIAAACERSAPPRLAGIAAGLVHAPASEPLDRFIESLLDRPDPAVQAKALYVAARRRIDVRAHLGRLGESGEANLATAVADAAWRLRAEDVAPALQRFLSHARFDVRRAAVLALLCLAPARTAALARSRIAANLEFEGALATCLGIAGQLADSGVLMSRVEADPTDTSAVAALGILGAPASVPFLLGLLASDNDGVKIAAAGALDLMSGHHARERVTQTLPPDPEDASAAGEVREVERVNTSPEYWSQWWHRERGRLDVNARWRRGRYFSLGACIEELADPQSMLIERTRAYLELSARAPAAIAFEPDWFVGRQDESIDAWTAWWDRTRQART